MLSIYLENPEHYRKFVNIAPDIFEFDPIKEGLEGMPFYNRIAFKQNQIEIDNTNGKNLKMIDAREIVAIINMFNKIVVL